ncbi:MAG: aldo/keto reductase [Aquihabitans sp.]
METRSFPGSDLTASVVGLGCNNFGMLIDETSTKEVVDAAIEAGVNFFDTASSYGDGTSERFLGAAVGTRRDEVVIATKFPQSRGDGSCTPTRIRADCEASLARLGTDHIDLYQQHFPDDTPIDDVLATLADLVSEGKVRAIGHSNFSAAQHDEAEAAAKDRPVRFVSSQVHWNLLEREVEADVIPAAERNRLGVLPYFPLAAGLLTGKHQRGDIQEGSRLDVMGQYFGSVITEANFDRIDALTAWASDHDRTLLELAFQWLASHESVVSVIAGATKPEQVRANARAVARLLTPDERRQVSELT